MNAIDIQPVFSVNMLDRMDMLRPDILNNRHPETDKYLLLSRGSVLLNSDKQCFMAAAELSPTLLNEALCVFLGGVDDVHYFALALTVEQADQYEAIPLRDFVTAESVPSEQFGLLAEANSVLSWHHSHAYCSRCGTKSTPAYGGWKRECPNCNAQHFPRTDPVVIMLVTHGDKCLLGRSYNFPEKRYSCLAGFMEPGETFEQAGLRELWEESGIKGTNVQYVLNQPWPFPSNLMIGLHIEAVNTELNIDYKELEDAMWVTKDDVKAGLLGDDNIPFVVAPKEAIARNLLEYWVR